MAESDVDPMAEQIAAVWGNLMSAMTAQGASRTQIADVALNTAGAILSLTSTALWQDAGTPEGEEEYAVRMAGALQWCMPRR